MDGGVMFIGAILGVVLTALSVAVFLEFLVIGDLVNKVKALEGKKTR